MHKNFLKVIGILPLLLFYGYDSLTASSELDDRFTDLKLDDAELSALSAADPDILSQSKIQDFWDDGFLIIRNVFTQEEIQSISISADRLQEIAESLTETGKINHNGAKFVIEPFGEKRGINRIVWAGACEKNLLSTTLQPKLLSLVSQLLDIDTRELDLLANQVHYKLPEPHPTVIYDWHQDIQNRRKCDPDFQHMFIQTIVAIDEMNNQNGPILYIPRSHKLGDLHFDNMVPENVEEIISKQLRSLPFNLKPGDVLFMHPFLIHGSFANKSQMKRRLLINTFAPKGAHTTRIPERRTPVQEFINSLLVFD